VGLHTFIFSLALRTGIWCYFNILRLLFLNYLTIISTKHQGLLLWFWISYIIAYMLIYLLWRRLTWRLMTLAIVIILSNLKIILKFLLNLLYLFNNLVLRLLYSLLLHYLIIHNQLIVFLLIIIKVISSFIHHILVYAILLQRRVFISIRGFSNLIVVLLF